MLKTIFLALLVIGLGLFVVNQIFIYHYNTEFLMHPCDLCTELNPHLRTCFEVPRYSETVNGTEVDNSWWFNYTPS